MMPKLISERINNLLEKREEQKVRDKKARKKGKAESGRGMPSSERGSGLEQRVGKRGRGMMWGLQVMKWICIGHSIWSTAKSQ